MEHCILYIYSFALLLSFIDNQVVDIAWLIKKFHVKQWVLLRKYVGVFFFFCLDTKEEETRRKNQGWTSPGLLRKGRSGTEKWTRFVALRSNSIFQHRPSIPPLTPLRLGQSFFTPRRFAVGFLFRLCFAFCLRFFTPRRFAVGFLFWLCLAFGFCFFFLLFYLFLSVSLVS